MPVLKSLPTPFRALSIAALIAVLFSASFVSSVRADEAYDRRSVRTYIDLTYSDDTPVRRFRGDVTWLVKGMEGLSSADTQAVFDLFDQFTGNALRKGDDETANLTIDYVKNVAFEAMTPDYRPRMQGDVADDAYVETLNQVAENRKNLVANFLTSDLDQTIIAASALAENHWAKRGTYIPPRRYLMQIVFFMLTGTKKGGAVYESVQASVPDLPEFTELPILDEALIYVLYSNNNWNALPTERAREELLNAMMTYLQSTGRGL
ncbi:hypothetical protein [Magnetovibrio sp.]|uniref:hypothetical protein n=1 Tax=Magnetovibrio sp. TaxID=2024836 RepID=UPI002F952F6A